MNKKRRYNAVPIIFWTNFQSFEFVPQLGAQSKIIKKMDCLNKKNETMMGRYSTDRPGHILANQGNGPKESEILVPQSRFTMDDDGIIPLMSANTEFTDNITLRFKTWLGIIFGEDLLME